MQTLQQSSDATDATDAATTDNDDEKKDNGDDDGDNSRCRFAVVDGAGSAPGVARVRTTLFERISRTKDPEDRARQLLDWLDRAWPPQAH